MARFLCPDCGFEKQVPDELEGRQAKCPRCGRTVSIAGPEKVEAEPQQAARFSCPQCGFEKQVPASLSGKKAKCPKCRALGLVTAYPPPGLPDDVDDISLDDLAIDDEPVPREDPSEAQNGVRQGYSDIDPGARNLDEQEPGPEKVKIISGNPGMNILSGAATGIVTVLFCFAFTLLIFSHGTLPENIGHGFGMLLAGAVVSGVVYGLLSGVPFGFAAPEAACAVLCYVMVNSIYDQMLARGIPSISFVPTITAALVISTLVAGLFLVLGAKLKIGGLLRFFPYQVAGGLLAGIGALALKGAWDISIAATLDFSTILKGNVPPHALLTLSGFAMALAMFVIFNKRVNTILGVACLLGFIGIYHVALVTGAMDMESARRLGLSYPSIRAFDFLGIFSPEHLKAVNWPVLASNTGFFFAMPGLVAVTMMAKLTRLEMELGKHVDMNRELGSIGTVNILSGLAAGIPSNFTLKRSLGAMKLGATCPLAGFASAAVCLAALVFADDYTVFLPRCLASALVAYAGIGLVYRWLIKARDEFSRPQDYAVTVVVFLVTVVFGFLVGAAFGLAIAFVLLVGQFGKTSVVKHMLSGATHSSNVDRHASQVKLLKQKGGEIFIMRLQGFVFIGTTNSLLAALKKRITDPDQIKVRFCILDFAFVSGLDSSVAMSFAKLHHLTREYGVILIFTNVPLDLEQTLEEYGFKLNNPDGSSMSFVDLDHAMEWCENRILEVENLLSVDAVPFPKLLEQENFPDPEVIPRLLKSLTKVMVLKGDYVFRQGDPSDAMYFISTGAVNVQLELEDKRAIRLKRMGPGTVFGEMGIYATAPRSASIVADEDTILYRLSSRTLEGLQHDDPLLAAAVHRFVVNLLAERVFDANAKVRDLFQ